MQRAFRWIVGGGHGSFVITKPEEFVTLGALKAYAREYHEEIAGYLASLPPEKVKESVDRLFQFSMPLIVVCKGLEVPPYLIQRANQEQVPVLRTPHSTTPFIHSLTSYLDHMFAPVASVHGSLVDVYGCGLLFTGRSAIGKSETALDLVERGHRLVADDVVTITRRHGDVLIGSGNQLLRHHM